MIYLDNAATTKPSNSALEKAQIFNSENFFNPSALYVGGLNCAREIKVAKENILKNLHATNHEVVFTSCGSESDNLAIFSLKRGSFLTDKGEHSAVYQSFLELKRRGHTVNFINLNSDGTVNETELYDFVKNVGLYLYVPGLMLGENGYVDVFNDETNELIHRFTSEDWDLYTKENPYMYETPIAHVRIETGAAANNSYFAINHIKEMCIEANHFLSEDNFVNFMFGHGANGSIRMFYDYAHNDWLELAINQGILGLFLYLLYWFGLNKYRIKSKHNNVIHAYFTLFIIVFLIKSFFSMSYNMNIYASSVLGYMIATAEAEQKL